MQCLYSTLLIFTNTFSDPHSILFFSYLFFFNWKLLANCRKRLIAQNLRTSLSFHIEGALIGFNCLEGWGWRRKWYWGLDFCTFAWKFKCKTNLTLLGDFFPIYQIDFLNSKIFYEDEIPKTNLAGIKIQGYNTGSDWRSSNANSHVLRNWTVVYVLISAKIIAHHKTWEENYEKC